MIEIPKETVKQEQVVHPDHYCQSGIQAWDVLDAMAAGKELEEGICVWQVCKYLIRYNLKNGSNDLYKAKRYLERLIHKVEEREGVKHVVTSSSTFSKNV